MKQMVTAVLLPFFLGVMLSGCGAEDTVFLERAAETTEIGSAETETGEGQAQSPEPLYVYVCGAVKEPGVYRVEQGARVFEVIGLAGGFADDASPESLNQAGRVTDGQMIRIPTKEEAQADGGVEGAAADGGVGDALTDGGAHREADGRLDLNRASAAELMELPGIGEAKAKSIVAYREAHGAFSSAEELMEISGIKEGVYNRIRDYIRVN